MAVSYGSASSNVGNGSTVSVTKPASTASGDFLIAFLVNDAGGLGISGGATWTELTAGTGATSLRYRVMYKLAGGSEPSSYTVAQSAGGDCHASIIRAPGGSGTPAFTVDTTRSGTSITSPSVTPDGSADLLIRFVGGYPFNTALSWSPPASHAERTDQQSTTWTSGTTATQQLASGAATGTANFTASVNTTETVCISVTIAGAVSATVTAGVVDGAGEVPAPGVQAGQTVRPGAVDGQAEVPAHAVGAGQTAHPAVVEAAGEVPAPNVVAGSAQLVQPAVVEAGGEVPAPSITAVESFTVTPGVVEAAGDVPVPSVSATFAATIVPDVVEAQASIPSAGVSVPILPGTLITQDAQVEWGGTALWGTGTSYRLLEITGWDAKPQLDDLTQEEPARHGANAGVSYLQRRIVTVKLQVDALSDPTEVSGLLAQLRYDTRTLRDNTLWTLVIRGYTETLMAFGKVIDRTGVMDRDWSIGAPEPVITIMCPDPRRYSLDQYSVVIPANAASPTTLVNDGDVYSNPTLRFAGPATNPLLINETLDRVLGFDMTIGSGELLVVDTQRGKATIGTTDHENDISDTISVPIKEFFLEVGSNELSYETDSGGTGGVEVLWRDANE